MPGDYKTYPANWQDLRAAVLRRAGNCCEGSPAYPNCRAENGKRHPITGSRVVLATAPRFDDDLATTDVRRLRAMCQRCNLTYDMARHLATRQQNRCRAKEIGR
jgi:hypothetical protein